MLAFVLGVGIYYTNGTITTEGKFTTHSWIGVAITAASTVAFLACALGNPGILEARDSGLLHVTGATGASRAPGRSAGGRRCSYCDVVQPAMCSHCEFCEVCVLGWDHHC